MARLKDLAGPFRLSFVGEEENGTSGRSAVFFILQPKFTAKRFTSRGNLFALAHVLLRDEANVS